MNIKTLLLATALLNYGALCAWVAFDWAGLVFFVAGVLLCTAMAWEDWYHSLEPSHDHD